MVLTAGGASAGGGERSLVTVTVPLDVAAARILLYSVLLAGRADGAVGIRLAGESDPTGALSATLLDDLRWLGIAAAIELLPAAERRPAYLDAVAGLVRRGRVVDAGGRVVLPLEPGPGRRGAELVLVDAAGEVNPVFAAAIDELLFGAGFVLREDREREHIALQQHVFAALDRPPPRAAYAGVLLPDADDLPTVAQLRRAGIEPEALVTHLALLGWSPPAARESFTLAELGAAFSLDRLGRAPAHFNAPRLRAFNARALRALPREQLAGRLAAAMQAAGLLESPIPAAALRWIETFLDAYGDTFATLREALATVADLRAEAVHLPALELEKLRNRQVVFYLDAVSQYVDAQPELRDLPLTHDLPVIAAEFGIAAADAFAALRMALFGQTAGPPLHLLFPLLGHERIFMRIGAVNSHLLHGRGLEPIKYGPGGVPFKTIEPQRPAST